MIFVHDTSGEVAAWVSSRISDKLTFRNAVAIGLVDDTKGIIGGVVFHDYQPNHGGIQVSTALEPGSLTRRFLKTIFGGYAYGQLGVRRVYSCISEHNHKSLSLCERIGFKREGVMRQAGFDGEDLIMLSMLRDENKWK